MFKKIIKKMGTLTLWEWSIFKASIVAFTLVIVSLFPVIASVDRWIYGIVALVTYAYVIWRMFIKK